MRIGLQPEDSIDFFILNHHKTYRSGSIGTSFNSPVIFVMPALRCVDHVMPNFQGLLVANKLGTLMKKYQGRNAYQRMNAMEWLQTWLDKRRVKSLKQRIARMKIEAEAAEVEPLMPAVETISPRIRRERLVVLERAVEKIEQQQTAVAQLSDCISKTEKI